MRRVCLIVCVVGLGVGCSAADEPVVSEFEDSTSVQTGGKSDSKSNVGADAQWAEVIARCGAPAEDEVNVYVTDFEWGYTPDTMATRYEEIYSSGKRLAERAYYDDEREAFMLPSTPTWGGDVQLPLRLVENVRLHIERGLQEGVVDFVFFPDMGHAHLFIKQDAWDATYADYPIAESNRRREVMFDDPELKVLYHTAEQLEMLDENNAVIDDEHARHRHATRNLVGANDYSGDFEFLTEPESAANTGRDLDGYKYYSAGFNVSASKDGCFPFEVNGQLQWFDLSLSDLPYPPDYSGGDGDF